MKEWKSLKGAYVKRAASSCLALGLAVGTICTSTLMTGAADKVNLEKTCAMTVTSSASTDESFVADLITADVVIDAYLVASAELIANVDGYTYDVLDTYSSAVTIPDDVDSKTWSELAEQAAWVVKANLDAGTAIIPEASFNAGETISGLDAGLYLLIARGRYVNDYFTTVTFDEKDENGAPVKVEKLVSVAYSDIYEYDFAPEFISLPTKDPDPVTGEIRQSNEGDWLYSASISMKPSRQARFGELKIIKDLLTFETNEPAYFIFEVEATMGEGADKKVVYSNVFSLEFTAAKESYVIAKNIPAGADVTVTEVYSGASYTIKSNPSATATIIANDMVSVTFTNDYVPNEKHGGAITNHFDYDLDENGEKIWHWKQYGDSTEEGNK